MKIDENINSETKTEPTIETSSKIIQNMKTEVKTNKIYNSKTKTDKNILLKTKPKQKIKTEVKPHENKIQRKS